MRPLENVLWNLFLAAVPVALAFGIARGARREMRATGKIRWGLWLPLALVWLAFLPNTCYLLTEWRHYLDTLVSNPVYVQAQTNAEARVDFLLLTAFYVFYSGAGLLAFFLAIWPLDRLTRRRLGRVGGVARALIFPLCALGVYLGLMPAGRFNSWDLLNAARLRVLLGVVSQTLARPHFLLFVLVAGAILWLLYALFDIWMDGAAWRLHSYRQKHRTEAF